MITAQELLEKVEGGITFDEARMYRDAIKRHTGLHVPRRASDVREWIDRNKSVLTRKAREASKNERSENVESEDETPESKSNDGNKEKIDNE